MMSANRKAIGFVLGIVLMFVLSGLAAAQVTYIQAPKHELKSPIPVPPVPHAVPLVLVEEIPAYYLKLAARAGFDGINELKADVARSKGQNELRAFLNENHIPVYDEADVIQYMDKMVGERQKTMDKSHYLTWGWRAIQGTDAKNATDSMTIVYTASTGTNGYIATATSSGMVFNNSITADVSSDVRSSTYYSGEYSRPYDKPIPDCVLEIAATIKDKFPEAKFDVTDVEMKKFDPFMRVCMNDECLIIAEWDEPGFTGTPRNAAEKRNGF